jgi:hypothetical protein
MSDHEYRDGGLESRSSIGADMLRPAAVRPPEPDGAVRVPEPDERPTPHAQWDEVQARWVEWDQGANAWVAVTTDPAS